MSILLTEFDPAPAIIEPASLIAPMDDFPPVAVGPFSGDLFHSIQQMPGVRQLTQIGCANGKTPVLAVPYQGVEIAVFLAPVGASCCVGALEELHALGAQSFLTFGSCGVLDRSIQDGGLILPTSAFRDEGTSYHYAPPADEIDLDPRGVALLTQCAERLSLPYCCGKVWTTDAFYRETPGKMARRKAAGAIAVEMECAALAACAAFRGFSFATFLYSADNLDAAAWDKRGLSRQGVHIRDQVLGLAFEAALALDGLIR